MVVVQLLCGAFSAKGKSVQPTDQHTALSGEDGTSEEAEEPPDTGSVDDPESSFDGVGFLKKNQNVGRFIRGLPSVTILNGDSRLRISSQFIRGPPHSQSCDLVFFATLPSQGRSSLKLPLSKTQKAEKKVAPWPKGPMRHLLVSLDRPP